MAVVDQTPGSREGGDGDLDAAALFAIVWDAIAEVLFASGDHALDELERQIQAQAQRLREPPLSGAPRVRGAAAHPAAWRSRPGGRGRAVTWRSEAARAARLIES